MQDEDYQRAITLLSSMALEKPTSAKTWARLGEAQFRAGLTDPSHESFLRALELDADLTAAHLYLGYIAEGAGDISGAMQHYRLYVDGRTGGHAIRDVTRRLELLKRQWAARFASEAISHERDLPTPVTTDSTIGIIPFDAELLPPTLKPIARGMAEILVTDFTKVPGLRVVERMKTDRLLDELERSQSALYDTSNAPRVGKLLGAAHLLGGQASELSHGRLRFDPHLVHTETGDVMVGEGQFGEIAQFFRMEKQIVFDVIDTLGIILTPEQRAAIGEIPTRSFSSFLAYSRGLLLQDRGLYEEAQSEFEEAARLDPDFVDARNRARETGNLSDVDPTQEPRDLSEFSDVVSDDSDWREPVVDTHFMLGHMNTNVGLIRPAGGDDPETPPEGKTTLIIEGTFDP